MRKLFMLLITSIILLFATSCNKDDVINNLKADKTDEINFAGNYGEDEYDTGVNFGYIGKCCTNAYNENGLIQPWNEHIYTSWEGELIKTELAWYGPIEDDVCYLVTPDSKFDICYILGRYDEQYIESFDVMTIGNVKINGVDCSNMDSINVKNQSDTFREIIFHVEFENQAYIRLLNCYESDSTKGYIEKVQELFLIKSPDIIRYDENGKIDYELNPIPNVEYRNTSIYYDPDLNHNHNYNSRDGRPAEYDAMIYYSISLNGLYNPIQCWKKIHINWDLNTYTIIQQY